VAWTRTDTSCRRGTSASPDSTVAAGSNPAGTSKVPGCTAAAWILSSRNVRTSPLAESAPVTYQRPEWATIPYGCTVRSLRRPSQEVYVTATGLRCRAASASLSSSSVSGVTTGRDGTVKSAVASSASSRPASTSGSTRRTLAAALSAAATDVVTSPARRPATRPSSTARASSPVSISGGIF
jgi:hypothetical protein